MKYRPEFPDRFTSIEHGLEFCGGFFHWQNHEHHHWGLLTVLRTSQRHGLTVTIVAAPGMGDGRRRENLVRIERCRRQRA